MGGRRLVWCGREDVGGVGGRRLVWCGREEVSVVWEGGG